MEYRFPITNEVKDCVPYVLTLTANQLIDDIKLDIDDLWWHQDKVTNIHSAWKIIRELEQFIQIKSELCNVNGLLYGIEVLLDSQLEGE